MNNESDIIWKEAVVKCFKLLIQNLLGEAEGNHEKPVRIAGLWTDIQS
jgi:hypothetical protein